MHAVKNISSPFISLFLFHLTFLNFCNKKTYKYSKKMLCGVLML